jgi:acetyltransferase-like isoleucine patch superfamily enzyme
MTKHPRRYDLNEIYGNETNIQRYVRLTCGEGMTLWALCWQELLIGLCSGLPGVLGWGVRNRLYSLFFKGFHKKAFIGRQLTLRCPRQIHLSAGVIVDDFVQLIATSSHPKAISIGQGSFVRSYAMLNSGPPEGFIHIGSNSTVGQGSLLYGNGGLTIGNNVMIAGQCSIIASSHNYEDLEIPMISQGYTAEGITIYDNVWIGAGARILDGVTVGEGSIVGANAVVNSAVAPGDRVGGIPARSLKGNTAAG